MESVLSYLHSLGTQPAQLRQCKLLLVGSAGAGKTTLLDALDPLTATTAYADSSQWMLSITGLRLDAMAMDSTKPAISVDLRQPWMPPERDNDTVSLRKANGEKFSWTFDSAETAERFSSRLELTLRNARCHADAYTHGVNVRKLVLVGEVAVYAWDCAGQRSYYHNHHHFLSDQSVYLVVCDLTQRHNEKFRGELLFWLHALRAHLPPYETLHPSLQQRTAIMIVGTHLDQLSADDRPRRRLRERGMIQPAVRECGLSYPWQYFEVTTADDLAGLAELRTEVAKACARVGGIGVLTPAAHVTVEEQLDALSDRHREFPVIRLDDIEKSLPSGHDISRGVLADALRHLHAWGRVVFNAKADSIVLAPAFLTQRTLGQLHSHSDDVRSCFVNGRTTRESLELIWEGSVPADRVDNVVELLISFDACFFDSQQRLVFPELLSEELPDGLHTRWPEDCPENATEVCLVFQLSMLPPELVGRLLARLSEDIVDGMVWRTGVILSRGPAFARVDAVDTSRRIEVLVRSANRAISKTLLVDIVHTLRGCLALYPGVSFDVWLASPDPANRAGELKRAVEVLGAYDRSEQHVAFSNPLHFPLTRNVLERAGLVDPNGATPDDRGKFEVFLSHAGEDKAGIVSHLEAWLRFYGVRTFLDERSLQGGNHAPTAMRTAARESLVGVFVLSPEFFQKEWPMEELAIFLDRFRQSGQTHTWYRRPSVYLLPVYYRIHFRDYESILSPQQITVFKELSNSSGIRKDAPEQLDADLVKKTVECVRTILRQHGSNYSVNRSFLNEEGI